MMSAMAPVCAREGSGASLSHQDGQPRSDCGQSPCRVQPSGRAHCSAPRASPSVAHQDGDQLSAST